MIDKKDYYLILMDLPGINPEDIHISFYSGRLVIESEGRKKEEGKYLPNFSKRRYGPFSWSVEVPWLDDEKNIEAKMKNGVLHVTIKKTEAKPSKIKVKASEE